jgi:hypothetical protein
MTLRRARWWLRWPIAAYDRLYRWLNGLDRPGSLVGPVLRVHVRRSRRTVRLGDGSVVRRGDPIGIIHLNNERVVALHAGGRRPETAGLQLRRQFVLSLRELARLTDAGGPLAPVKAFTASTIFHHGMRRLGFEPARGSAPGSALVGAYQRALLAVLHPGGGGRLDARIRDRAEQLWISREVLRARFRASEGASTAPTGSAPGSVEEAR